jgi:hypothetical protein
MNVRGLFPSLGAGGSLIAAVLSAAALLGGTLAFRGEPGGTAEANGGDVTVPGRTVRVQRSSSERFLALAAVGRRAARTVVPARERRTRSTVVVRTRRTAPRGAPLTPRTTGPADAPVASQPSTPSGQITSPVTGTVARAVQQIRAVADPVIDRVPDPAEHHGDSVTDTVEQVAGTVDGVTDGLLP